MPSNYAFVSDDDDDDDASERASEWLRRFREWENVEHAATGGRAARARERFVRAVTIIVGDLFARRDISRSE